MINMSKQDFLKTAGGNTPDQIFNAAKSLNLGASDVDSIMGYEAGTSSKWLDGSGNLLGAPKPVASLDSPPTIQPAMAAGTRQNHITGFDSKGLPNMGVYAAPSASAQLNSAQAQLRDFVSNNLSGATGNITDADATKLYSMAMSGQLSKQQVSDAVGVPMEIIDTWLAKSGLPWPEQKEKEEPAQTSMFSLDSSPVVQAITKEVQPNQTAAHQLVELLSSSSPYIRQIEKDANRDANALNLRNSSYAVGNSRAAAIRAGLPIALNDANTYAQQAIENQRAQNSAASENAQILLSRMNTMEQLAQSERESIRSNETSRLNQLAENEVRISLAQMSDQTQVLLERMRNENNINMNDMNARTQAFNNMIVSVGNIEGNPEMSAQQKSEAIARTVGYYDAYLSYLDKLGVRSAAAA